MLGKFCKKHREADEGVHHVVLYIRADIFA